MPSLNLRVCRSTEGTYYDPVGTAKRLILDEQPVPVDLIAELEERGYIFEAFKASVLDQGTNIGFSVS